MLLNARACHPRNQRDDMKVDSFLIRRVKHLFCFVIEPRKRHEREDAHTRNGIGIKGERDRRRQLSHRPRTSKEMTGRWIEPRERHERHDAHNEPQWCQWETPAAAVSPSSRIPADGPLAATFMVFRFDRPCYSGLIGHGIQVQSMLFIELKSDPCLWLQRLQQLEQL